MTLSVAAVVLEVQELNMSPKIQWISSPFFRSREGYPLDMLVIHHIGSKDKKLYSVSGTIAWFSDEKLHVNPDTGKIENQVSAHYILPRLPYGAEQYDVIHMVREANVAYHAGKSQWVVGNELRTNINNYSIGIELEGDGNLVEYTDYQYENLIWLIKDITCRYKIPEENIVGHEDIAPGRKVDPGKLFDWKRLRKGLTPSSMFIMPEATVDGSVLHLETVKDEEFYMGPGSDDTQKSSGLWSSFFNFIAALFKKS